EEVLDHVLRLAVVLQNFEKFNLPARAPLRGGGGILERRSRTSCVIAKITPPVISRITLPCERLITPPCDGLLTPTCERWITLPPGNSAIGFGCVVARDRPVDAVVLGLAGPVHDDPVKADRALGAGLVALLDVLPRHEIADRAVDGLAR